MQNADHDTSALLRTPRGSGTGETSTLSPYDNLKGCAKLLQMRGASLLVYAVQTITMPQFSLQCRIGVTKLLNDTRWSMNYDKTSC